MENSNIAEQVDRPVQESPDDKVITGVYRRTRTRIRINAAIAGVSMLDYIEKIVPIANTEIQVTPDAPVDK